MQVSLENEPIAYGFALKDPEVERVAAALAHADRCKRVLGDKEFVVGPFGARPLEKKPDCLAPGQHLVQPPVLLELRVEREAASAMLGVPGPALLQADKGRGERKDDECSGGESLGRRTHPALLGAARPRLQDCRVSQCSLEASQSRFSGAETTTGQPGGDWLPGDVDRRVGSGGGEPRPASLFRFRPEASGGAPSGLVLKREKRRVNSRLRGA